MSQGSGLSEAELADNIHRFINLKLDKEAFMRPNRDVIREIYSRFLDQLEPNWRDPEPDEDLNEVSLTMKQLKCLRMIFRHYNLDIDFNAADLSSPTRKRTNLFLNAILYCKAEFDVFLEERESEKVALAREQEDLELLNGRLAEARLEKEELAFRIGDARNRPARQESLDSFRMRLIESQNRGDQLAKEAELVKTRLKKAQERKESSILESQRLKNLIEEKKLAKANYQAVVEAQDDLAKARHLLEDAGLKFDIKEEKLEASFQMKTRELLSLEEQYKTELGALRKTLADLEKKNTAVEHRTEESSKLVKSHIDRAEKQYEIIENRYHKSKQVEEEAKAILTRKNAKINSLVYGAITKAGNATISAEGSNNATYIKS